MEAIPLSQWLWLVSSWHKTVRHKLLLFLASQYPCIHLSLLAHVDHRSNVHTTLPASMCLPPQLEDLTKICVWEQWSTSPTKLSCWAWHVSSPPCFQFYPVILHPKCVKCLDLGGQDMQPGREPALSFPLWWASGRRSVSRSLSSWLSLSICLRGSHLFLILWPELGTLCSVGKLCLLKYRVPQERALPIAQHPLVPGMLGVGG